MVLTDVAMSLQSFLWLSVPTPWPAVLGASFPSSISVQSVLAASSQ